jgi:hypothetical protein
MRHDSDHLGKERSDRMNHDAGPAGSSGRCGASSIQG